MLRIPVNKIESGMVLARPIPLPQNPYRFLVQRDQVLDSAMARRLKELGIVEVWIRYRPLEFLEDLIDEQVSERQREVYIHVRKNFEQVINDTTVAMDMEAFQQSIGNLFDSLKQCSYSNVLLEKLDHYDNYLMSHSTNVCFLAMLLGMNLRDYVIQERHRKSPQEAMNLKPLGLGALLHDVGKMKISPEILNKTGRLNKEEMNLIKQHPRLGYEMVNGLVPAAAADVILNHHQRFDGTGYPQRVDKQTDEILPPLAGKQISVFSRIATICDVYDAATSKRCYSDAKLSVQVLHEMHTFCRGFFDPVIAKVFFATIPPFPIGQVVKLSDGVEVAVVDFNPKYPVRPKVQGIRKPDGTTFSNPQFEEIDLAINPELIIVEVHGVDVRAFQESQQGEAIPNSTIFA